MKKSGKKILCAFAALLVALPCAVSPVFASSRPYRYEISNSGVMSVNGEGALAVESEKLTFNISSFPDDRDLNGYDGTVTAEYHFVNTGDDAVTTTMAFPIDLNGHGFENVPAPRVEINGTTVDVQTRHTFEYYPTDFSESVKKLHDGLYEDDFYKPDMTVTHYTVSVNTGKNSGYYRIIGDVTCGDNARYMSWLVDGSGFSHYLDAGENKFDYYVFGDAEDVSVKWRFQKYKRGYMNSYYVNTDKTFPVSVTAEQTTLKDFVLSYRGQDSAVSETDWYNGFVQEFGSDKYVSGSLFGGVPEYRFLTWYLYEVHAEPNERFTNTVTAPLLPTINYSYTPDVYGYSYYISPAASWKSFGEIEIVINTPYYVVDNPLGLTEQEGGFGLKLDGLPERELEFSLCSSQNPTYHHVGVDLTPLVIIIFVMLAYFLLVFLGGAIYGIVYLVKLAKRRYN